jgi:hypothetical protein
MIQATFKDWTLDTIDEAFGTKQIQTLPALDSFLEFPHTCTDYEWQYLTDLRKLYALGGDEWNEVELENKFISPLIIFAKIDSERFAYFLERPLSAILGDYAISGRVDGMIATGYRSPKKPLFCLAEYKRQTDPDGNPQGQVLATMIAGRSARYWLGQTVPLVVRFSDRCRRAEVGTTVRKWRTLKQVNACIFE